MTEKFIIIGGNKLSGEVEIMGSKNAALPILVATILTKKDCVIDNLPLIEDIYRMLEILEGMGAKIEWQGKRKIKINCSNINPEKIPQKIIGHFRGSVLVLGPLLARFGKLKMLSPGGCIIGARPLDTHFDAFLQLGFENYSKGSYYYFKKSKEKLEEKNREVALSEFSVTATENVLLFSSFFPQKTILKIADLDYQVQELIKVLKKMGAKIKTAGPHSFKIEGKKELSGFEHKLI
ncbi:MAG: UDP-N-acetylglucosamine 1-carboxyvinyltransferase, partial [bacterium]|nr:UDP-N-acetylglucosamine 1-carboxyvinyltransferase [bacterium]